MIFCGLPTGVAVEKMQSEKLAASVTPWTSRSLCRYSATTSSRATFGLVA